MPETDELIPTREAAGLMGESVRQFIRRVERGEVEPAMKLPGLRGAYLFNRGDLATLTPAEDGPAASPAAGPENGVAA